MVFFQSVSKKSLIISLLGHLTAFSIFSLSFGTLIPKANFTSVSFWGAVLGNSQVMAPQYSFTPLEIQHRKRPTSAYGGLSLTGFIAKSQVQLLNRISASLAPASSYYLKPPINHSAFVAQKNIPIESPPVLPPTLEKREPMILFHPVLPYGFGLYFKDRQVAHVELSFNIGSGNLPRTTESRVPRGVVREVLRNSITVKRRISSGNLEVDLLCMRYIGHYLFIEQERFAPDNWQAVKIDLSEATTYGVKPRGGHSTLRGTQ